MKKSSSCIGCQNYKGAGCFYILADKVELCPKVIKDYEKFRSDNEYISKTDSFKKVVK